MPRHKSTRSRFSWSKLFLVILVIACALAIIWTGYLLYTRRLSEIPAIVILAITIGVLIWNASLLRRYKVGGGIVFAVFIVTALLSATVCAFSGIEPLASLKQKLTASVDSFPSQSGQQVPSVQQYPTKVEMKRVWASSLCYQFAHCLYIEVKPTANAVAQKSYTVDLYENGSLRATTVVQWNQPELNVLKEKYVNFPISRQEYDAYKFEDISHIFTIKVHE